MFHNLKKFSKNLCENMRMENQTIRMKILREKYLKHT